MPASFLPNQWSIHWFRLNEAKVMKNSEFHLIMQGQELESHDFPRILEMSEQTRSFLCAFCAGHSGEVWKGTERYFGHWVVERQCS